LAEIDLGYGLVTGYAQMNGFAMEGENRMKTANYIHEQN